MSLETSLVEPTLGNKRSWIGSSESKATTAEDYWPDQGNSTVGLTVIAQVSEATKTDALSARATVARYSTISDAPGPTIFVLLLKN